MVLGLDKETGKAGTLAAIVHLRICHVWWKCGKWQQNKMGLMAKYREHLSASWSLVCQPQTGWRSRAASPWGQQGLLHIIYNTGHFSKINNTCLAPVVLLTSSSHIVPEYGFNNEDHWASAVRTDKSSLLTVNDRPLPDPVFTSIVSIFPVSCAVDICQYWSDWPLNSSEQDLSLMEMQKSIGPYFPCHLNMRMWLRLSRDPL